MKQKNENLKKWYMKMIMVRWVGIFMVTATCQLFARQDTKETISVYGLKSIGIPKILARSLQEHLESNLIQYDRYSVLSRNDIETILKENNYQQSNPCLQKECIVKVGHLLEVDKIVTGTISKVGSTYNLVLKLIDIKTTEIEISANNKYSGSIDSLLMVMEMTVEELCKEKPVINEEPLITRKEETTIQEYTSDTLIADYTIYENEFDSNSVIEPVANIKDKKGMKIGIGAIIVLVATMYCLLAF